MKRRRLVTAAVGALVAPALARAQDISPAGLQDLARRATTWLFPLYEMVRLRWRATVDETNPQRQRLNRFRHVTQLADHRLQAVSTPNSDTLYSTAWLDLSIEPMFLTVPPVGDLYYCYAFLDLFSNNIAYVSHRLYGAAPPPTHMVVGPNWRGEPSSEVRVVRAPTNSVWLLGRILVDAPDEVDRARILQARTLLETPDMRNERRILEAGELMRYRTVAPVEPVADWPAPHPGDPLDLFDVGMAALGESPLAERDRARLVTLAPLRLRPGRRFDRRAFSDAERHAVLAGVAQGHADIRAAAHGGGQAIDGWRYGERHLGNFGDDDLYRAATALVGLGALERAEAAYVSCESDAEGDPLSGTQAYRLAFPADGLPPAAAFWSLSAYALGDDGRARLVENPIGRYAIGDRTPGLRRGADGSLVIHLQVEAPAGAAASNWLPTPRGRFRLVLRAYEPGESLIEGRYRVPGVRRGAPA